MNKKADLLKCANAKGSPRFVSVPAGAHHPEQQASLAGTPHRLYPEEDNRGNRRQQRNCCGPSAPVLRLSCAIKAIR